MYLWLKAAHIIAVIAWFAGLFYLPRLFVYHASCQDQAGNERFKVMERKLFFVIMNPAALVSLVTGLWLLEIHAWRIYSASPWLHLKFAALVLLFAFHFACYRWMVLFREDRNPHSERFYRIINEVPTILLIAIVILVVVKPF